MIDLINGLGKEIAALTLRCLHQEVQWCLDLLEDVGPSSFVLQPCQQSFRMTRARNLFALKQFRAAEEALNGEPDSAVGFLRCYFRWIAIDLEAQLGKGHRGPDFIHVGDSAAIQTMLSELLEMIKESMKALGTADSYLLWLYTSYLMSVNSPLAEDLLTPDWETRKRLRKP